jgi:hypothetical protein
MSILKSTNSGLSTIPITVDTLYELGYRRSYISEDGNDTIFVNSNLPLMQIKHYQNTAWNNEKFYFRQTIMSSTLEDKFGYNPEVKTLQDLAEIEKEVIKIYKTELLCQSYLQQKADTNITSGEMK